MDDLDDCFFIVIYLFFFFILLNFYLFIYLFIYVFIFYFLSFVAVDFGFIFYWPICCLCMCAFNLIFYFFCTSLFILCAVFISLQVGLGLFFRWSEIKIYYFGVVYKCLSVGMELVVVKDLFIILYISYIYIYIYWLIYCDSSIFIYLFID